jgi:hypothetical protein
MNHPPTESTDLARGQINGDELAVELRRPADTLAAGRTLPANRAVVVIVWPPAATVVSPATYGEVAAFLTRLFASSATTLAAMKAGKQL